jgi:hypothetical protein
MGHVTIVNTDIKEARRIAEDVKTQLKWSVCSNQLTVMFMASTMENPKKTTIERLN